MSTVVRYKGPYSTERLYRDEILTTLRYFFFFFFNDTATTEIYTLSLHDALPICPDLPGPRWRIWAACAAPRRSEEHTSELQSPCNLVCRLLLEKKKKHNLPLTVQLTRMHVKRCPLSYST